MEVIRDLLEGHGGELVDSTCESLVLIGIVGDDAIHVGEESEHGILAVEANGGDSLVLSLVLGPHGLKVCSMEHLVSMEHAVEVFVDISGGVPSQS